MGPSALTQLTGGDRNIAIGFQAGILLTGAASDNIYIGNLGDATDVTGTIRIGELGTHTRNFQQGIVGVVLPNTAVPVYIDPATGQLGTIVAP